MSNFTGTDNDDVFNGDGTNEIILGKGGNDTLFGNGGQDLLEGGTGADLLNGGDGDDRLYSAYEVTISLPYYTTAIFSPPNIDSGTERDELRGGDGSDVIYAGYGDTVDGGANGGYGDYLYISFLAAPSGITFDGGLFSQVIGGATISDIENISFVQGSNFDDTINGRSTGTGYSSFAALMGMGGNDTLLAGYYTGTLFGGDGNDIVDGRGSQYLQAVYGDDGDDTLYTNSNTFASAYGGAGNDTIYAHGKVFGGSGNDIIYMQGTYYTGAVYGESGDDEISAAPNGNTISGGDGGDRLIGGDANDVLSAAGFAGEGNNTGAGFVPGDDMGLERDVVTGGGGNDDIGIGFGDDADGGAGSDQLRLSLAGAPSGVMFDTTGITGAAPFTFAGGTISNFETLVSLRGSEFADTLNIATQATGLTVISGGGDDLIVAHGSSVSAQGGAGNDRFVSGIAGDTFDGGLDFDTIDYSAATVGGTITFGATQSVTGIGLGGDTFVNVESVIGSAFNDTITGSSGADRLSGGAGNDTLDGRTGADTLLGGLGDDIFVVDNIGDVVTEFAGEGTDTVRATLATYVLGANVENLIGTAGSGQTLTGNDLANTITGGNGNDTLDGGAGADSMIGGLGNDIYVVDNAGDVVTEQANAGTDTIRTTLATFTLAANFENLTGLATTAQTLTGNDSANTIIGGLGNDTLDGGAGADSMIGGMGDDNFIVDNIADVVTEVAGEGTDTVRSTLTTYALSANVENLIGTGGSAQTLTGNDLANTITGGNGNDTLDGGAGADTLLGGLGDDIFVVDNIADVVTEVAGEGTDTVRSTLATYVLGANVENLIGTAGSGQTLTGNDLANTITGGNGNDTLDGGAGADSMIGGLGNDIYVVDNAGDVVTEQANAGTDTIRTTLATFTLAANFEYLTGLATTAQTLTGNDSANTIIGGLGNDTLNSDRGNDTLTGGVGNDRLDGGSGLDVAVYAGSRAQATVTRDAVAHTLIVNAGAEGTDTLIRAEQVQFSDGLYSFNFANAGAPVVADFAVGAGGWSSQTLYPRHVADVNGDGFGDIVGFGQAGVLVSYGSANGTFSNAALVIDNFGQSAGWTSDDLFHRELGDINGDGRADIIGFGQAGTLVSLARTDGTFGAPTLAINDFGTAQGWTTQDRFARTTGDVNGDGRADLVGFGQAGTFVALGNSDGTFQAARFAASNFGVAQGWSSDTSFHRTTGDVNGDGKADLIGFGAAGTYVALSNGDGTFQDAKLALANFGTNQGWTSNDRYARAVADINHDGVADIVGFGQAGTLVAYGNGDGTFSNASFDLANFGAAQGWSSDASYHREIADINHDGLADIVGFGFAGVLVGTNQGDFLDRGGFADIATLGQADSASADGTGSTTPTDGTSDVGNFFLTLDQSSGPISQPGFDAFAHDSLIDLAGFQYSGMVPVINQGDFLM